MIMQGMKRADVEAGVCGSARPSFGHVFMETARLAAKRSDCPPGKRHGAALIVGGRLVSTGYNGPPSGSEHCGSCTIEKDSVGVDWRSCPAVHAEENAVLNAARAGVSPIGAHVYVTKRPCEKCESRLRQVGVSEVFFLEDEPGGAEDWRDSHPFEEIARLARARQEDGRSRYGAASYEEKDMYDNIVEELLDVMVYAYLEVLKIWKLKEAREAANKKEAKL